MRQILTDHARARASGKRNWSANVTLEYAGDFAVQTSFTLVALDDARESVLRIDELKGRAIDLRYIETVSTATRVLISPSWTVANGSAALDLQTVDSFTGLTLTQGYPAAPVTSTLN